MKKSSINDEVILYYLLGLGKISKKSKFYKKHIAFIDKYDFSYKDFNLTGNGFDSDELNMVYEFLSCFKKGKNDRSYIVAEQFFQKYVSSDYRILIGIYSLRLGFEIDYSENLDEEIILNSYKLYLQKQYSKSYKKISEIHFLSKYERIVDFIMLLSSIQLNQIEESWSIYHSLQKKVGENELMNRIKADIYYKSGKLNKCKSIVNKLYKNNYRKNDRTNFAHLCLLQKSYNEYYHFLKDNIKLEEEYFFLAKFYHRKGLLDKAYEMYQKCDQSKYPVNKMLGLIEYQLGNMKESYNHFIKEDQLRGYSQDNDKMIRYIKLEHRWKK